MSVQQDIELCGDVDARTASAIPLQRGLDLGPTSVGTSAQVDVERFGCCDVQVAALNMQEAVDVLRVRAQAGIGGGVHLCNTFTLKLARDSGAYRSMLNSGALNLADGTPLTWVARRQGHSNMQEPTRGPGLMDTLIRDGLAWGAKHYFYGSTPEVIELLREVLPVTYPGIEIVGLESPPFRDLDDGEKVEVRQRFGDSGAHFVWVGLGTPKQDVFVHEFAPGARAVVVAVGAAFDFASGMIKEAPSSLHGSGFEWVFRLVTEPRRLARRYARCMTLIPSLLRSAFVRRQRASTERPEHVGVDLADTLAS